MTDRRPRDRATGYRWPETDEVEQRLGRHAIALLQAARDAGDPMLIAQAEAMALAVGFALAARSPDLGARED
jgi:hypothetical protein